MGSVVAIKQRVPKKMGRPTLYSPELCSRLLARMSGGLSLRAVCRHDDMPVKQTVLGWLSRYPEFMAQYLRAMEARGCACGEQVIDVTQRVIAGDLPPDVGRVAIIGLTWAAARMAPKAYGDRVAVTGHDGGAVKHAHTHELLARATDEQLDVLEATVAQIDGVAVSGADTGGETSEG